MGKRKKTKKIIIKANSISKKKKVSECCRCNKDKKIEKLCVRCGNNPAWLDYAFCYDCYLKQIEENKEKINNYWHGGTGEKLFIFSLFSSICFK